MRDIVISGEDGDGSALSVEILDATSSEADSGINGGDKPNDIVITGDSTLQVRAERFSKDGRVYTIDVKMSDGENTVIGSTEVVVPHDRGKRK